MKVQVNPKICVIVRRKAPRIVLPIAKKAGISMVPSAVYELTTTHHLPDVPQLFMNCVASELFTHIVKI